MACRSTPSAGSAIANLHWAVSRGLRVVPPCGTSLARLSYMTEAALGTLLSFLSTEFAEGRPVDPEQRLVPDVVDSLGVFVLADFVQRMFGIELADEDLSAETLANATTLWTVIEAKRTSSVA